MRAGTGRVQSNVVQRSAKMAAAWLLVLAPWCAEGARWRVYENAVLKPDDANDGDSFHVRYKNREYVFRLYYVDAPETDLSFPERVQEQARYWGVSEQEVLRLGDKASKFTRKWLQQGPFTVYSMLQDARGRSQKKRYYAVVRRGEDDLGLALVRQGLARIHGLQPDLPDGTRATIMYWRLRSAEKSARAEKLGGWAEGLERGDASRPKMVVLEPVRAVPPRPAQPELAEQALTLSRPLDVYSLRNPGVRVGVLQPGARVKVVEALPGGMVRIRFIVGEGRAYEAQCRRAELGL